MVVNGNWKLKIENWKLKHEAERWSVYRIIVACWSVVEIENWKLKIKMLHLTPIYEKLKIEARSRKMIGLSHRFTPIVLWQILAPFVSEMCLHNFTNEYFNISVREAQCKNNDWILKNLMPYIEVWQLMSEICRRNNKP